MLLLQLAMLSLLGLMVFSEGRGSRFRSAMKNECGKCYCERSAMWYGISANCSTSELHAIPHHLPSSVVHLDVSMNKLGDVTTDLSLDLDLDLDLCKLFPRLRSISVAHNNITHLGSSFVGCKDLLHIDLTGNRLRAVGASTFQDSASLEMLVLEVDYLKPGAFGAQNRLKTLAMTYHALTIESDIFDGLKELEQLTLVLSRCQSLPYGIFKSPNLKELNLSVFKIKSIDLSFLSSLDNLKKLNLDLPQLLHLSMNMNWLSNIESFRIVNIKELSSLSGIISLKTLQLEGIGHLPQSNPFFGLKNIKALDITDCSMSKFPEGWFSSLTSLEDMNLSHSGLSILETNTFAGLLSLKYLNLAKNKLRSLSADTFAPLQDSLRFLILRENLISSLQEDTFTYLTNLNWLDLSHNEISTIEKRTFEHMSQLTKIDLQQNRLSDLDDDSFYGLPLLIELELSGNNFLKLPKAVCQVNVETLKLNENPIQYIEAGKLCQMTKLKHLWLKDNPINCDCGIKKLMNCLHDRQGQVHGTCSLPNQYQNNLIREFGGYIFEETPLASNLQASPLTYLKTSLLQSGSKDNQEHRGRIHKRMTSSRRRLQSNILDHPKSKEMESVADRYESQDPGARTKSYDSNVSPSATQYRPVKDLPQDVSGEATRRVNPLETPPTNSIFKQDETNMDSQQNDADEINNNRVSRVTKLNADLTPFNHTTRKNKTSEDSPQNYSEESSTLSYTEAYEANNYPSEQYIDDFHQNGIVQVETNTTKPAETNVTPFNHFMKDSLQNDINKISADDPEETKAAPSSSFMMHNSAPPAYTGPTTAQRGGTKDSSKAFGVGISTVSPGDATSTSNVNWPGKSHPSPMTPQGLPVVPKKSINQNDVWQKKFGSVNEIPDVGEAVEDNRILNNVEQDGRGQSTSSSPLKGAHDDGERHFGSDKEDKVQTENSLPPLKAATESGEHLQDFITERLEDETTAAFILNTTLDKPASGSESESGILVLKIESNATEEEKLANKSHTIPISLQQVDKSSVSGTNKTVASTIIITLVVVTSVSVGTWIFFKNRQMGFYGTNQHENLQQVENGDIEIINLETLNHAPNTST